ncbi:MAG: hypothetical protein FWE67_01275 [Planctomycetaceae bacterium]|nr:hypothetical protein [Planctomycetaceae bacterium]
MKLHAYSTPDIEKHAGYLKIGETHGDIDKRVQQQGHTVQSDRQLLYAARDCGLYGERSVGSSFPQQWESRWCTPFSRFPFSRE